MHYAHEEHDDHDFYDHEEPVSVARTRADYKKMNGRWLITPMGGS